jgi:hypothetical protein
MRAGRVLSAGPVAETVTGPILSGAFGLPLRVHRIGERFGVTAADPFR